MGWHFWTNVSKVMALNPHIPLNHSCRDFDCIGIKHYPSPLSGDITLPGSDEWDKGSTSDIFVSHLSGQRNKFMKVQRSAPQGSIQEHIEILPLKK